MSVLSPSISSLFECDTNGGLVQRREFNNSLTGYAVNISHVRMVDICNLVIECQSKLLIKNLKKHTNNQGEINNEYDITQGFLVSEWSTDDLVGLLSLPTSLLICAVDSNNNRLAGYQLLTPIQKLVEYINPEFGQLELDYSLITEQQWNQIISSPDVHYSEQTGVAIEYRGQGVGSYLVALAKSYSPKGICVNVIFWPYNNVPSASFRKKTGFQAVAVWNQSYYKELFPFKAKIYIWPPVDPHH